MSSRLDGLRRHKLLTKAIEKKLAPLRATDGRNPKDIKVIWKCFSPYTGWRWYFWEYDPETRTAFGLTVGDCTEVGSTSLDELEDTTCLGGVPAVERDCYYSDQTVYEIAQEYGVDWLVKIADES